MTRAALRGAAPPECNPTSTDPFDHIRDPCDGGRPVPLFGLLLNPIIAAAAMCFSCVLVNADSPRPRSTRLQAAWKQVGHVVTAAHRTPSQTNAALAARRPHVRVDASWHVAAAATEAHLAGSAAGSGRAAGTTAGLGAITAAPAARASLPRRG